MPYVELQIDQGTTFETTMNINNDDGTFIDITDYEFDSQIRKSYYSSTPAATITTSIHDAANGEVKLSLSAAQTANIKAGRYLYDVRMTTPDNVITRVIEGIITVTPQITK